MSIQQLFGNPFLSVFGLAAKCYSLVTLLSVDPAFGLFPSLSLGQPCVLFRKVSWFPLHTPHVVGRVLDCSFTAVFTVPC